LFEVIAHVAKHAELLLCKLLDMYTSRTTVKCTTLYEERSLV